MYIFGLGGVLEIADLYPQTGALKIFGPTRRQNYVAGYENRWGGFQQDGDEISDRVATSSFGVRTYGWNWAKFSTVSMTVAGRTFPNALKVQRAETWKKTVESNYYLAPGLGFIGFDWNTSGTAYPVRAVSIQQ